MQTGGRLMATRGGLNLSFEPTPQNAASGALSNVFDRIHRMSPKRSR